MTKNNKKNPPKQAPKNTKTDSVVSKEPKKDTCELKSFTYTLVSGRRY